MSEALVLNYCYSQKMKTCFQYDPVNISSARVTTCYPGTAVIITQFFQIARGNERVTNSSDQSDVLLQSLR